MRQQTLNSRTYTFTVYDDRGHLIADLNGVPANVLVNVLNMADDQLKQQGKQPLFNVSI